MKPLKLLLAGFAAWGALIGPCAAATYSFSGFFGEVLPPGRTDHTATFSVTFEDFVRVDASLPASALSNCSAPATPCARVDFFLDARASGLTLDAGVEAIALTSTGGTTGYFYFESPAFATPGTYESMYGFNPGTLIVAVPEPDIAVLTLAGLPLLLLAARLRRRKRVSPSR